MKNITLVTTLAITLLLQIPLADARDRYRERHSDAVAAGLLGLGLGMAITAPRVYHREYWDDDYRRYPRYRKYWRHRPYYDRYYDYRDHDWDE